MGCIAHARRKFHELWVNHQSQVGEQALKFFGQLYDVECEVADSDSQQRCEARRRRSRPVADALHQWLIQNRQKVPDGSATAKAIGYSLNHWAAPTRYIDDGELPIDNNWGENQIRPIAIGRNNWLFAGSLRAGKRAAAIMSLVLGAAQRHRAVRLPARHPRALAYAAGQSRRRRFCLIAGSPRQRLEHCIVVKRGSPDGAERPRPERKSRRAWQFPAGRPRWPDRFINGGRCGGRKAKRAAKARFA